MRSEPSVSGAPARAAAPASPACKMPLHCRPVGPSLFHLYCGPTSLPQHISRDCILASATADWTWCLERSSSQLPAARARGTRLLLPARITRYAGVQVASLLFT